jgi:membrane associated rhomboid family serine protease
MTNFRSTRFEILPPVVKNLIIINALVFLAQNAFGAAAELRITELFALHGWQSPFFKPWQFLTSMFMHAGIMHIFLNMYALWIFGSILENMWGPKRFFLFYLICGFGADLCHMFVSYKELQPIIDQLHLYSFEDQQRIINSPFSPLNGTSIGASGAIFGCLAGFAYLFPNTLMQILFIPVPIKAKWLILGYSVVELALAIRNAADDNVNHVAHLGGALFGFLLVYFWNKTNRKKFY